MSRPGRAFRLLPLAVLIPILALTLHPKATPSGPTPCTLCIQGGLGDILLNIALYLPLGWSLVRSGWPPRRAVFACALLSLGIEILQVWIPGRFADISDVVANAVGGGLGVVLARHESGLLRPAPSMRVRLLLLSAALACGTLLLTAALQRPVHSEETHYPLWTPRQERPVAWRGTLLHAEADGVTTANADAGVSGHLRKVLKEGSHFRFEAVSGPRPGSLAPIFEVRDERRREMVFLGQTGDDLVWRTRRAAPGLGLFQLPSRWPGALAGRVEGERFRFEAETDRRGNTCLTLDGLRRCDLDPRVSLGWGLLFPSETLPAAALAWVSLVWLAGLSLLPGFWARGRRDLWILLALPASLAAATALGPFLSPTPMDWAGMALGMAAGQWAGRWAGHPPPGSTPAGRP